MKKQETIAQKIVENLNNAIEALPKVLSFEDARKSRSRSAKRRPSRARRRVSTLSAAKQRAGGAVGRAKKAVRKAKRSARVRKAVASRKTKSPKRVTARRSAGHARAA